LWTAAEPVAKEWVEANAGVAGALREAGEGAGTIGKLLADIPGLLSKAEQSASALADMARNGVRLDRETVEQIAAEQARGDRWGRAALWIGALSLLALAVSMLFD
jgi:ubiquinone biosynthesis protein